MKLLIVADRYYPDVVGGGEISLYHLVEQLRKTDSIDVSVIAQSEEVEENTTEHYGKVKVERIPVKYNITEMRPNYMKFGLTERLHLWSYDEEKVGPLYPLARKLLTIKQYIYYFFTKTNSTFIAKISLLISNFLSRRLSRENVEYLEADYPYLENMEPLYDRIRKSVCDAVHLDNTRSILRYYESNARFASVGVVRDLKFFCPRRNVIAHTTEGICTECNYRCLKELPWTIRPFIKRVFDENRSYRREALKNCEKVVCTSIFLKGILKKQVGVDATVIPNIAGIEDDRSKVVKTEARDKKVVLFVGMLQYNKGPDIAIDVIDKILKDGVQARLLLAGRGPEYFTKNLEKKARDLGIEDSVEFLGFLNLDELKEAYGRARVAITPSRWPEPFGRVPIEAMSFSVPVVAFRLGGFVDTVLDNETGFLVDPTDTESFYKRVKELLVNDRLWKRMSKESLESVGERFSPDDIANSFLKLYTGLSKEGT